MSLDRHTRSALRRELQRAEEERARLAVVISYLHERLREGDEPSADDGAAVVKSSVKVTKTRTRSPSQRVTAAAAAEKILRERGRPMKTPDLLPEVQAAGAKIKSTENLFRSLRANPAFRRIGRGLWGLAEWPDSQAAKVAGLFDDEDEP